MLEWGENPSNGHLYGTLIPHVEDSLYLAHSHTSHIGTDSERPDPVREKKKIVVGCGVWQVYVGIIFSV